MSCSQIVLKKDSRAGRKVFVQSRSLGQTVFELVIALGVAALVVTGIVQIVTISLRNASFAKNQALATRYNQEALEWLRAERDKDWIAFSSRAGSTWCLTSLSWSLAAKCGQANKIPSTIFIREATVTQSAVDSVDALVRVVWTDASGEHSSRVDTTLTDWRQDQ